MFTGLVEELASVAEVQLAPPGVRLSIASRCVFQDAALGDSISVSGCCLTVVKKEKDALWFDIGAESLSRTTLGRLAKGDPVNLERSLALGDRLGGHLVTGHIDCTAALLKRRDEGEWSTLTFGLPARWSRQLASKGSIAVDGVSLTLVNVERDHFSVALIPHTLQRTTLGQLEIGCQVNLETDLLAKYVERQLESLSAAPSRR